MRALLVSSGRTLTSFELWLRILRLLFLLLLISAFPPLAVSVLILPLASVLFASILLPFVSAAILVLVGLGLGVQLVEGERGDYVGKKVGDAHGGQTGTAIAGVVRAWRAQWQVKQRWWSGFDEVDEAGLPAKTRDCDWSVDVIGSPGKTSCLGFGSAEAKK
jgi:hypothetical protein